MDTEDFDTEESHLVKDLRKQLDAANKRAKTVEEELTGVKSQYRERTVASILSSKGLNPKVAKFIPADVDGEDAVSAWLEDNSDLFTAASPAGEVVQQESPVSDETRGEMQRANALQERGVSPDVVADFEQRIANADSLEEINSALSEYQKYQL